LTQCNSSLEYSHYGMQSHIDSAADSGAKPSNIQTFSARPGHFSL